MTSQEWDFDTQMAQTFFTVATLVKDKKVAENVEIALELFFTPTDDNNPEALLKALKTFGYMGEPGEKGEMIVRVENLTFNRDEIWLHEERLTKLALTRGYTPDGWGFLEP